MAKYTKSEFLLVYETFFCFMPPRLCWNLKLTLEFNCALYFSYKWRIPGLNKGYKIRFTPVISFFVCGTMAQLRYDRYSNRAFLGRFSKKSICPKSLNSIWKLKISCLLQIFGQSQNFTVQKMQSSMLLKIVWGTNWKEGKFFRRKSQKLNWKNVNTRFETECNQFSGYYYWLAWTGLDKRQKKPWANIFDIDSNPFRSF